MDEKTTVGATPCPCTQNQEPLSLECQLTLLETNANRMNYRLGYTEHLHRKVDEKGDIQHYERMVPQIVKAAAIGAVLSIGVVGGIMTIYNYVKNR